MGYTALLFCPDEKTARTVTQVLSELEFNVEACTEPFAAVKKLMGQHFEAVVVDCDNEQNATLLFKSARNSTHNQTSLAVAVVEGQAGVAKAFRIGANLVLTKPINVEHAKGTLRVARGLLRKSEPGKPATPASTTPVPTGSQNRPSGSVAASESRATATPGTSPLGLAKSASSSPHSKPAQDDDPLGIDTEEPAARPTAAASRVGASVLHPAPVSNIDNSDSKPAYASASQAVSGGGAGSAAAPARAQEQHAPANDSAASSSIVADKPASAAPVVPAPTLTFGGSYAVAKSSGSGKKVFVGVAAGLIFVVGLYAAWAHFRGAANQSPSPPSTSSSVSPVSPQEAQTTAHPVTHAMSAPAKPTPLSPEGTPASGSTAVETKNHPDEAVDEKAPVPQAAAPKSSAAANQPAVSETQEDRQEPAPLVVKGGKVTPQTKVSASDDPAPSMIGLAAQEAGTPPPTLIPEEDPATKPTLQALNISQGVSQGLLIKKVAPEYPSNAIRLRIEGTVELMATISKAGEISHIKILSGDSQLTKAAADAVKQWKYKPYLLNGEPVEIQTQVTVNFKLPH
jgi:periplasmic protein TonB